MKKLTLNKNIAKYMKIKHKFDDCNVWRPNGYYSEAYDITENYDQLIEVIKKMKISIVSTPGGNWEAFLMHESGFKNCLQSSSDWRLSAIKCIAAVLGFKLDFE